jgi:hypothetical protein
MSDATREPWPKPIDAPSLGIDPVAHLARRQPTDPSLARLITVRVQGGTQDGDELLLPEADVMTVLQRARRFRAMQWPQHGSPDRVVQDLLIHRNDSPLIMRMPGGWIEVGVVGDCWAGQVWLRVIWQEWSNRVRVETPPAPRATRL